MAISRSGTTASRSQEGVVQARRGQAALEYFIMLSIALAIAAPLMVQAQQNLIQMQDASRSAKVQNALSAVERGARLVNSQGDPARATFTINLPDRINDSEVGDNYVYYRLRTPQGGNDFYRALDFNVSGKLPTSRGIHEIRVEDKGSYVNISEP